MDVNIWNPIFGAIVAVSTCVYVFFTWKLLQENKQMREALSEPQLIFYLETTEVHADMFYIKIENIGSGIAKQVKFHIDKDLELNGIRQKLNDIPLFNGGFNVFPPGYKDEYLLLSSMNVNIDELQKAQLCFKVTYKTVYNKLIEEWYTLKFGDIITRGRLKPPGSYIGNISYRLENIDKHMNKISSYMKEIDFQQKEEAN
ncbi:MULTISPECIES: hypothetical protein [unclassified Carboxylicivirga]|uniref:hypothetical protein n=1 Tax=Carboxylicivirga TaxID=1628153 RepID=UPI003D34A46E